MYKIINYDTMILLAMKEMDIFNKHNMYETHIKQAIGIEGPYPPTIMYRARLGRVLIDRKEAESIFTVTISLIITENKDTTE